MDFPSIPFPALRFRLFGLLALLAAGSWGSAGPPPASAQDSTYRRHFSSQRETSWRSRQAQLRNRRERTATPPNVPRHPVRATHRGWEIRTEQFVVFANTNLEDAEWTAEQFARAWAETARLADNFTDRHQQPGFGLGTVLVEVDGDPLRRTVASPVQFHRVGTEFHIYINTDRNTPEMNTRPELVRHLPTLRMGAAQAFLHAAELQTELPAWFRFGLAAYVAQGAPEGSTVLHPQVRPDQGAFDPVLAVERVHYLLHGQDAELAPAAFAAARETLAQPSATGRTPLDQLVEREADRFAAWKEESESRLPSWIALEQASDSTTVATTTQEELVTLLKIARRVQSFSSSRLGRSLDLQSRATFRTPQQDLLRLLAADVLQTAPSSSPAWATVAADGQLLLASDHEELQRLFASANRTATELRVQDGRLVVRRRLPDGRVLSARSLPERETSEPSALPSDRPPSQAGAIHVTLQ